MITGMIVLALPSIGTNRFGSMIEMVMDVRILKRMTMTMVMESSMVWMIVMTTQPNTIGAVVWPTITIPTDVMMRMKTLMMTATRFSMSLMPARGTHTIELGLLLY